MTTTCPECNSRGLVVRTGRPRDGQRPRRMVCRECGHRWTAMGDLSSWRQAPPPRVKLTPPLIAELLQSHGISSVEMGRRLRVSHQTVSDIRLGKTHRNVMPDIPRWNEGPSCEQCLHWSGACGLGFPDPEEEGVRFAADCSSFEVQEAAA